MSDKSQDEFDQLKQEFGNEIFNLLENYMKPEDICFILDKGDDNAKAISSRK